MSNLHRGHSIDASYQISVVAMFVTDLDKISNLHRGHSIDDSHQISVVAMFVTDLDKISNLHRGHSIDDSNQVLVVAMFVNRSGRNVHSLERTFHRCFLPSFNSFGWGFSEEKIKMWKENGWQTTDTKWWQKFILSLARFAKKNIKMWIVMYRINMLHYISIS